MAKTDYHFEVLTGPHTGAYYGPTLEKARKWIYKNHTGPYVILLAHKYEPTEHWLLEETKPGLWEAYQGL